MGLLRQQVVWWGFAAISRSRKSPHNEICLKPTAEEEEALVTSGGACKFSCSFLKQQLLLLMEDLLSKSLFHIPNPSAVGYSSTQPEKINPHQPKLNLHAQKNPISAQVLGGSGLCPLRTSIGTSFIAPPPSLSLFRSVSLNPLSWWRCPWQKITYSSSSENQSFNSFCFHGVLATSLCFLP